MSSFRSGGCILIWKSEYKSEDWIQMNTPPSRTQLNFLFITRHKIQWAACESEELCMFLLKKAIYFDKEARYTGVPANKPVQIRSFLFQEFMTWTCGCTCVPRLDLLCDVNVWLWEERVALQEKSSKCCQSPVEEHQAWFWRREQGAQAQITRITGRTQRINYLWNESMLTHFLRMMTARRSLMSWGLMQWVMSSAA